MYGVDIESEIVILDNSYSNIIKDFNCGNKAMNLYLDIAYREYLDGIGFTKLIIDTKENKLIGYYTLCSSALIYDTKNKDKIKRFPAIEIKMFAIDKKYQDMSFSEEYDDGTFSDNILFKVIREIRNLSETSIAIKFILLYAEKNAIKFYKRNLFCEYKEIMIDMYESISEGCTPLYMRIE